MDETRRLDFESSTLLAELNKLQEDDESFTSAQACFALQKQAVMERFPPFTSNPQADYEVSPEALECLLQTGEYRSDIRTHPHISDCFVFHTKGFETTVIRDDIIALRKSVDNIVRDRIPKLFKADGQLTAIVSGHFYFPPGGFMGWHTNSRVPGWRFYVTHAEEPGKSFLRFRDPKTNSIITAWDKRWNVRLFRIDPQEPLWHAVYSSTHRYSIGYGIVAAPDASQSWT